MARQKQQTSNDANIIYYRPEDVEQTEDHYLNRDSCLNVPMYIDKECHLCNYSKKCIYRNKYNYRVKV